MLRLFDNRLTTVNHSLLQSMRVRMQETLKGGCACGAVRYQLKAEPIFVQCCHCHDCQRQVGSAFVVNALIETSNVVVESGTVNPIALPTDSGLPHRIFRCAVCQTALWSEYKGLAPLRFVRVCTLDDPSALEPKAHIYTRSKLPWVRLPEGVPAFEAFYDGKKLWPAASLARWAAMRGR